jgi:hypothetical protein
LVFETAIHEQQCREALAKFISSHDIVLSEKTKLTTFYELVHYTRNGIEFLIDYCKENRATRIEFESSLGGNSWNLVGAIDCLVHLPNGKISLFDFKRSGAAIGSKRETVSFQKVQIWVYLLLIMKHQGKLIHTWGYLNLSEVEASQIYNEEESPFLKDEVINSFQDILVKAYEAMNAEVYFLPKPRNEKVCDFCEVKLFCSKGNC